jgi:hypothetical protein
MAELVEERDPALLDVAVDVLPAGRVAGLDGADHGPGAGLDQLDPAVGAEVDPLGRHERRILHEDEVDLVLEPIVVPAEPVADPLGLGERAPDLVAWRVDRHLDAEGLVHAHAG